MKSTRHVWYHHLQDTGSRPTGNRSWEVSLWEWLAVNTTAVVGSYCAFLEKNSLFFSSPHTLRQKLPLLSAAQTAPAVTLPVGTIIITIRFLSALVTHRCSLQPSPGGFTHFYTPTALLRLKGHIAQRQHTSQDSLHVHLLLKHKRKAAENLSAHNIYNTEAPEAADVREKHRQPVGKESTQTLTDSGSLEETWKSREERNRTEPQNSNQKETLCLQEAQMEIKRPQNWPVLGSPPCQGHCTPLGICASSVELHLVYQIVHLCTWESVYPIQNCHTTSTASQSYSKGTKQISTSGDMKGKETFPR